MSEFRKLARGGCLLVEAIVASQALINAILQRQKDVGSQHSHLRVSPLLTLFLPQNHPRLRLDFLN